MTAVFYANQVDYIPQLNALWDRATVSVFGTSTTSLSISTGNKSFTTAPNLQFATGSQVTLTATADLSKYMSGQISSYDQETGDTDITISSVNGSGTFSSWSITLSGAAGATGAAGVADNISIGTVTSGGTAAASITGTSPNKFLNLTLEKGDTGATGAPNVLSIGTVTSGGTASATITGTSPTQTLNLVLPKGDTGNTGATGAAGLTARGVWNGAIAYVTSPSVDWVTYLGSSYYRKVAGTTGTDPATDTTNWGILALKGTDGAGTVVGVTASAPLASSGGSNPNITITQANTSTNGYLSSTDWNTFNGKQAAIGYTPANKAGDTFTGNVGIGGSSASESLKISKNITGLSTSRGVVSDGVIQSDVTASSSYYNSVLNTVAASFTVPFVSHYSAMQGTIGAGSVVTNQFGFSATASLIGATNNYGFYGAVPSGTGRWNLYMPGTALNYMAGNLLLGSTTDTGEMLQVTGNAKITGTLSLAGKAIILGGNLTTSGAFASTFTMTGTTTVTFPTTGTLLSTATTVTVPQGGTGLTTLTSGGVLVGNGTSAPSLVAPSTAGNVLTSDGGTWISSAPIGGGGLVRIGGSTASAVSSIDFTNVFDSTYDKYVVSLQNITGSVASASLRMQIYVGGSFLTANYLSNTESRGMTSSTFTATYTASSANAVLSTTNHTNTSIEIYFSATQGSNYKYYNWEGTTLDQPLSKQASGFGLNTSTGAMTGFKIFFDSGTISGSVQIYGYKKS